MRRVTLDGSDVTTSALGFGTAHLMARISRRDSVRLLEAAYDAGITHFDTARLYGYGEAESALGDFIRTRRDRVTVATKFGIFPPRRSRLLQAGKALARMLVRVRPGLRRAVRSRAAGMVTHGRFGVEDARRSLEASLRTLRTDYVDILFLHECQISDIPSAGALRACLDDFVARGLVRHYGIATDADTVFAAASQSHPLARLTQFPSDAANDNAGRIAPLCPAVITHSPFGRLLPAITRHLTENADAAARWMRELDVDGRDTTALAALLLSAALADNPHGVVVCSSGDSARIRANATVVERAASRERRQSLRRLLASVPLPSQGS